MLEPGESKMPAAALEAKPLPEYLPPPTVWPVTMALAVALLAFGVVTSWMMSSVGFILFVVAMGGWFEDLRNDTMQ